MEAAKIYFSRLLKVYPIQGNNLFPRGWTPICMEVNVGNNEKTTGIPNSDLHLYVNYLNDANISMLANAGFCAIGGNAVPRPVYGRV